ncbi:hypothetical protein EPO44_10310 [bacterium]|nr:MAG: hypothetical protein EPO44_10310 [bacterium]
MSLDPDQAANYAMRLRGTMRGFPRSLDNLEEVGIVFQSCQTTAEADELCSQVQALRRWPALRDFQVLAARLRQSASAPSSAPLKYFGREMPADVRTWPEIEQFCNRVERAILRKISALPDRGASLKAAVDAQVATLQSRYPHASFDRNFRNLRLIKEYAI